MPELPEVESVVRALNPALTGRSIKGVKVLNQSTISGSPGRLALATGHRILTVKRRGKYLLIDLDGGLTMAVHLRMTGWLGVKTRAELARENDKFVRVAFDLDGNTDCLIFRDIRKFGRIWCGEREKILALKALSKLGPEPLEISAEAFLERLKAKRGRLKSILLDQTFLAGLGNIYADEALFDAGLHPLAQAPRVAPASARRLHAAIQKVLNKSISAGGSSIDDYLHPDGTPGWFQRELKAYGREGEPCVRCKSKLKRIVLGQRGTWFCPKCQKKR